MSTRGRLPGLAPQLVNWASCAAEASAEVPRIARIVREKCILLEWRRGTEYGGFVSDTVDGNQLIHRIAQAFYTYSPSIRTQSGVSGKLGFLPISLNALGPRSALFDTNTSSIPPSICNIS